MNITAKNFGRLLALMAAVAFLAGYVIYASLPGKAPTPSPAPAAKDPVPEIAEFEGYINYGQPIQTFSLDPQRNSEIPLVATSKSISQPIFTIRRKYIEPETQGTPAGEEKLPADAAAVEKLKRGEPVEEKDLLPPPAVPEAAK